MQFDVKAMQRSIDQLLKQTQAAKKLGRANILCDVQDVVNVLAAHQLVSQQLVIEAAKQKG